MMREFFNWFLLGVLLGLTLGVVHEAKGEERPVCLDTLGLQADAFPVQDLTSLLPEKFCGGNLDWSFGTKLTHLKAVLDTGKVVSWRAHFFNGPGLRNGQLGRYEPHSGHTVNSFNAAWEKNEAKLRRHLRDRVRLYCLLFAAYPAVVLEMSPTLEHNLSVKAFRNQARVIENNCPRAIIVDNPVKGVASTKGFKIERHGAEVSGLKAPCNVSLDGDEAFDANIPEFLAKNVQCQHYTHARCLNGRLKDGFVDPRQRKNWCTKHQLATLLAFSRPLPYAPFVEGCVPVKRPRLYKVMSDDHGIGDVRANKPLWLTPYRAGLVRLFTATGNIKLGDLPYYGPFEDGSTFRYYSGLGINLYGIEIAERSERLSGSPYVVIREQDTGNCFGPVLPYLRHGYFR